jgi:hypothetical protein
MRIVGTGAPDVDRAAADRLAAEKEIVALVNGPLASPVWGSMKRRVLRPYPILAVALTAAAGCEEPAPPPDPHPASVVATSAPKPTEAPVQPAVYRPLTDNDGYPLVGNMIRKGGAEPRDAGADSGASR